MSLEKALARDDHERAVRYLPSGGEHARPFAIPGTRLHGRNSAPRACRAWPTLLPNTLEKLFRTSKNSYHIYIYILIFCSFSSNFSKIKTLTKKGMWWWWMDGCVRVLHALSESSSDPSLCCAGSRAVVPSLRLIHSIEIARGG